MGVDKGFVKGRMGAGNVKRGKRIANACVVCSSQSRLSVAIREMPTLFIDAGFLALAESPLLYFWVEGGIFQAGIIGRVFCRIANRGCMPRNRDTRDIDWPVSKTAGKLSYRVRSGVDDNFAVQFYHPNRLG